jgi:hypothetical protein
MTQDPDKITIAVILGVIITLIVIAVRYLDKQINEDLD